MRSFTKNSFNAPTRFLMVLKLSIFCLLAFSSSLLADGTGVTTVRNGNDVPDTNPILEESQQSVAITGKVIDEAGMGLPGVNVTVKGTTIGVMTSMEGIYTINIPSRDVTIQFSFIGYLAQEVAVGNKTVINVTLAEDVQLLEEVVVVGYGVQKKETLTGAVSQIGSEDIVSTKQADAVASLQGKVPGLLIRQNSSKPGGFASELSLRGYGSPMIVVDGVVRSGSIIQKNSSPYGAATMVANDMSVLQEINPEDIESISVLKDASATIYGLGAANGVLLITTKKGKVGVPSISYSNQFSLSRPTTIREVEDWPSFMMWDNAMADVAKMTHRFSTELIDHYINKDEGYYYTNWYDAITKKFASTQTHNLSLRGGSDRVTYYLGTGYSTDETIFKTNGYNYDRYTVNGNVTAKITDNISATYQTSMRFSEKSEPGNGDSEWNLFYYIFASNPMVTPTVIGNPDHYSNVEEQMNPAALLDTKLSNSTTKQKTFQNTVDVKYEAPFLKGLQITSTAAFDFGATKNTAMVRKFDLYDYKTDIYAGSYRNSTSYQELWMDNSRLYGRIQAIYATTFGKHNVNAVLGAEVTKNASSNILGRRLYGATDATSFYTYPVVDMGLSTTATNSGTRNANSTQGVYSRVNYSFEGKYLAEVSLRYDGTYYYSPGKRWGFFPAYSLAWRISEEKFMKNNLSAINNLKIRWSDGYTGSTQGNAYGYIGGYTQSGSWIFTDGATSLGWNNTSVANDILTWADVRLMDLGLDIDLWKSKLGGSFDWYKRVTSGVAATRSGSLPDFYGVSLPQENLNTSEVVGLDGSLSYRDKIGEFNFQIQATATYARSRNTYLQRARTDTYASSMAYYNSNNIENRWGNARSANSYAWADGSQFQNLPEVSESNVLYDLTNSNKIVVPGMYRIDDRNGDGYISTGTNNPDVYYRWNQSNPPLQYGLNMNGSFKNFSLSVVFSGGALATKTINLSQYAGFGYLYYTSKQFTEDSYRVAEYGSDPWDPNTEWVTGYYPALCRTNAAGSSHNSTYTVSQPYNFVNAAYLRLKSVEVGYTFSPNILKKAGIKSARIFVNAGNIATITNKLLKYVDPESNDNGRAGGYFQPTRTYSSGINLNF